MLQPHLRSPVGNMIATMIDSDLKSSKEEELHNGHGPTNLP